MNRLATGALVSLLLALPLAACDGTDPAPQERPNILIVVTDDQRALGTMDVMPETSQHVGTEGTTFSNAYVTTPLCCPSRASIFTGRYAHNHGVLTNFKGAGKALDEQSTFQRYLHDAGYRTGLFGKYLTSESIRTHPPFFDRWASMRFGYGGAKFNVGGDIRRVDEYSTDFIADEAVDFIRDAERDDAQPWLAYVAVNAPHRPFDPALRHADAPVPPRDEDPAVTEADVSDKPPSVQASTTAANADSIRVGQLRTLMAVDEMVGRLIDELEDRGELEDTLVIFTSDNGFFWGEHGLTDKRSPYAPAVRVPLLLRWPRRVPAGVVDERYAANIDIAPTLLDAAGVPVPDEMDGRSLLEQWERDHMFTEYFQDPGFELPSWAAVGTRHFRYVRYYDKTGAVVFEEYYDLNEDPYELENLMAPGSGGSFEVPDEMQKRLEDYRSCGRDEHRLPCP